MVALDQKPKLIKRKKYLWQFICSLWKRISSWCLESWIFPLKLGQGKKIKILIPKKMLQKSLIALG